MIDLFCDWFEGTWENKVQAFSQPSKFAMVRLIHTKVPGTDYMYYGEQAYNFSLSRPYRQFIVEAFEERRRTTVDHPLLGLMNKKSVFFPIAFWRFPSIQSFTTVDCCLVKTIFVFYFIIERDPKACSIGS